MQKPSSADPKAGARLKICNLKGKASMALRDLGQILFSNPSFGLRGKVLTRRRIRVWARRRLRVQVSPVTHKC